MSAPGLIRLRSYLTGSGHLRLDPVNHRPDPDISDRIRTSKTGSVPLYQCQPVVRPRYPGRAGRADRPGPAGRGTGSRCSCSYTSFCPACSLPPPAHGLREQVKCKKEKKE